MKIIRETGPNEVLVELDDGNKVILSEKRYYYLKKAFDKVTKSNYKSSKSNKPKEVLEDRYRNILIEEVNTEYAEIVDEYYDNYGNESGWVQIHYKVNSYGRSVKVSDW